MKQRKPALGFIFTTLALDIIGFGLVIPILPRLIESLHGGSVAAASNTYGLLASIYSLMQFIFAPLLGSLSDRFGRRPVILTSLLGSGLDYFLLAFAPDLNWFFLARIISGITGANITAATAYIADITPPEKRAANYGIIGAAFGVGFIAGPAIGGALGDVGLRVPFVVAGSITLINWLYGWLLLPESLARENRREFSWTRSNPVGALLDLRRHPKVFGLASTFFLIHLAHQSLPATWVLYTGYRYQWSVSQTGLSLAIVGLTGFLVQMGLTGAAVRRFGEEKSILAGLGISAMTYASYGLASQGWMLYVILVIGSVSGITGPCIQGLISRNVKANEQGGVQGSLTSLTSVSGIIGPPLMTGLFSNFIRPGTPVFMPGAPFFFSALLVLLALFLAFRKLGDRRDEHPGNTTAGNANRGV